MQSPSFTLKRQDVQYYIENTVSLAVPLLMYFTVYTLLYRALEDIENTAYRLLLKQPLNPKFCSSHHYGWQMLQVQ